MKFLGKKNGEGTVYILYVARPIIIKGRNYGAGQETIPYLIVYPYKTKWLSGFMMKVAGIKNAPNKSICNPFVLLPVSTP